MSKPCLNDRLARLRLVLCSVRWRVRARRRGREACPETLTLGYRVIEGTHHRSQLRGREILFADARGIVQDVVTLVACGEMHHTIVGSKVRATAPAAVRSWKQSGVNWRREYFDVGIPTPCAVAPDNSARIERRGGGSALDEVLAPAGGVARVLCRLAVPTWPA